MLLIFVYNEVRMFCLCQAPLGKEEFLEWQQDMEADEKAPMLDRPTVFRWTGECKEVYLSGSFNNWANKIPLIRRFRAFLKKKLRLFNS